MTPALTQLAQVIASALDDPDFAAEVARLGGGPEPWLTAEQAAELLSLRPATVNRYAREGKLTAHVVGRRYLFRRSEVDQDVVAGRVAA